MVIVLRLAVIGRRDRILLFTLRTLIDADIASAFTDVLRALAEAARDRAVHRGRLSRNQQDSLYLETAWRGCTDMQQSNHHRG